MSKKLKSKMPRRLMTATMSCVLMISLASCSGAKSEYGNIEADKVYAQSGNYSVTYGDLWDELKWNSYTVLEDQINNVILNDHIEKITLVMNNENYGSLSDNDKEKFENEENFKALSEQCNSRIVDFVVQDIYDLTYTNENYWDSVEELKDTEKEILEAKYVDGIYTTYKVDKIGDEKLEDIVSSANKDNDNYMTIAKELTYIYYPLLAKELLTEEKLIKEVEKVDAEDTDSEDDNLGYFSNSDYVDAFKDEYANKQDLNLVMIRFNTEDEFKDTLRAFGIKVYNNEFYYIEGEEGASYPEYCDYYDEFKDKNLEEKILDEYLLEVYIQIYNYLYSGYRTTLASGIEGLTEITSLNDLRKVTAEILDAPIDTVYENAVKALNDNNLTITTFTRESLDEIDSAYANYLYETLDLDGKKYSTSTENYNDSYYIAYKFGETEDSDSLYNKDLTDDEIIEIIIDEDNADVKNKLHDTLVWSKVTEAEINTTLTEELENVKVKIYDEATEIAYSNAHSEYSKTLSKNKNSNVLATIEYNDKKWNLNIAADEADENSIVIPGTTDKFSVFDELEGVYGQLTSIDLISKQIIKETDAYEETNEDRELYKEYIETILYNFANDGFASSGYSSSIGKYNFLMLYFHSADMDEIVDNFYRVQYASTKLLTDYSSDKLVAFFKNYVEESYADYFSLTGTRLVVSFDGDDDNEADDVTDWKDNVITFNGLETTLEKVAKQLIYDFYVEINASTESHSTALENLITEFNESARVAFDDNPILPENQWAKYRKLGLKVTSEEYTATNSSTDIDFSLKQRLFDYTRGFTDVDGDGVESDADTKYQYFMNETTPTVYLEPMTEAVVTDDDNKQIVETKDGYNLLLVTSGETKPSAEWNEEDFDDDLLQDIVVKYNDKYVKIDNIYNDTDILNENQIKLYILEYVTKETSNLTPTNLATSYTTFLSPVLTRFTDDETQRMIVLEFIENNESAGKISYTKEGYNDVFAKILEIHKRSADNYITLYDDTTGTSNSFNNWWSDLSDYLKEAK